MDTSYSSGTATVRGNVSRVTRVVGGGVADVVTYQQYDVAGNVAKRIDGNNNATKIDFDSAYQFGLPTKVTNVALAQYAQMAYDFQLGKITTFTDPNRVNTTYDYTDSLDRLKTIVRASGTTIASQSTFNYDDTALTVVARSDLDAGRSLVTTTYFDGLGRVKETDRSEDSGIIITKTNYDALGRVYQVSNPYRSGSAVWTATTYDALGRPSTVTAPDNSITNYTYSDDQTTVSDPSSKVRKNTTDSFGRLVQVVEDPSGKNYQTGYAYDVLDNLVKVCQNGTLSGTTCTGGLDRTFLYDGLSRLTSAANPETGGDPKPVTYTYDPNSNLVMKKETASGGRITCYGSLSGSTCTSGYDALNRPSGKSYNDGTLSVSYTYDAHVQTPPSGVTSYPNGRLTAVSSGSQQTTYDAFDALGRVTYSTQKIGSTPYSFGGTSSAAPGYTYNLAGALTAIRYPSGRVVNYNYDLAGRVNEVVNYTSSTTKVGYAPHGAVSSLTLANGTTETTNFNNRLQVYSMAATGTGVSLSLGYSYCADYSSSCTTNNGNVFQQTITRSGTTWTQQFTYDGVNRLQTAAELSSWSQNYNYDNYGNRIVSSGTKPNPDWTPTDLTKYNSSNQWVRGNGDQYDVGGNMIKIASNTSPGVASSTFTYDAENRLTSANMMGTGTASYVYDGNGRRVQKVVGSTTTSYVYDAMGGLAAEYSNAVAPQSERLYLTADALGSVRLVTGDSGGPKCYDYFPFGEDLQQGVGGRAGCYPASTTPLYPGSPDLESLKFTGKERDTETGLDYFGARYLSSAQGRFTSPDAPFADQKPGDPQSWNLYSYTRNNPLRYVDPDGRGTQPYLQALQRLAEIATRNPRSQQVAKFLSDNASKIAAVAEVLVETIGPQVANHELTKVDAATLMQEHPGLSQSNAESVVAAPFGSVAVVAGQNVEGADVKLYSEGALMTQTEVKVTGINNFGANLSDAAKQLGERGGTAFLQLPNGTTKDEAQHAISRFAGVPGRDIKKYQNVHVEVRDEKGNLLYSGGVQ